MIYRGVGQAEVGLIDGANETYTGLASHGAATCVILAAHNPESHQALLMHVDANIISNRQYLNYYLDLISNNGQQRLTYALSSESAELIGIVQSVIVKWDGRCPPNDFPNMLVEVGPDGLAIDAKEGTYVFIRTKYENDAHCITEYSKPNTFEDDVPVVKESFSPITMADIDYGEDYEVRAQYDPIPYAPLSVCYNSLVANAGSAAEYNMRLQGYVTANILSREKEILTIFESNGSVDDKNQILCSQYEEKLVAATRVLENAEKMHDQQGISVARGHLEAYSTLLRELNQPKNINDQKQSLKHSR